jgi:uncharacterized protein YegP (UPF0339 family)
MRDGGRGVARYQCFRIADGVYWRLRAGNNRVLGLGVREHADITCAAAEIATVQVAVGRTGWHASRFEVGRSEGGLWRWLLVDERDGERLAHSAQGFARRVDVQLAAERFVRAAMTAVVEPGLAVFEPGRRRRVAPSLTGPPRNR